MLSFGLSLVGVYDGKTLHRSPPDDDSTFYRELKPISERFEVEALDVNGLDREALLETGEDPAVAMTEAAEWVQRLSDGYRPILIAYPVAFDWSFLYWYFAQFSEVPSPFGHSSCLDIRTLYQAIAGTVFDDSGKASMPAFVQAEHPHTHNALDDAIEQGELFANLFEFATQRRNALVHGNVSDDATPSWIKRQMLSIS